MPRPSKGARLHRRADRGVWIIKDGSRRVSTGTRDRREAEAALARYLAERDRPIGPRDPSQVTAAEVLNIYATERAPHVRDPSRIGTSIRMLVPILGPLPLSSITGETCRRYGKARDRAPGTIRKDLGVLAAAINHAHAEGYITSAPRVRLPEKPAPRDRWLTREEVDQLMGAARSNPATRHVERFIQVAVWTGTRSSAILALRFMPHLQGGHVDTAAGLIYRRASGQAETKKRQPPAPIPRPLLDMLIEWEREGATWVVEYKGPGASGGRVASIKNAWRTVLKTSGIDHCTRHDLRHTAITWAMQAGADKWAAAGFFGLTLDMLESTYGHHHPDYMRSAVEALERGSFGPMGPKQAV